MAEEDAQVGGAEIVQQPLNADAGVVGGVIGETSHKISQPVAMPRKNETKAKANLIIDSYEMDLLLSKNNQHNNRELMHMQISDSEEGFLSTSPDSANGEVMSKSVNNVNEKMQQINVADAENLTSTTKTTTTTRMANKNNNNNKNNISTSSIPTPPPPIFLCTNPGKCVSLKNILDSFKSPLSEEQVWALIYQFLSLYRSTQLTTVERHVFNELELPDSMENLNLHHDGTVHCSWSEAERKEKEQKLKQQQQLQQLQHSQCDEQEPGKLQKKNLSLSKVLLNLNVQ